MKENMPERGILMKYTCKNSIPNEIRDFIPMAERRQPLQRDIVGIIGSFTFYFCPAYQSLVQCVNNFLFVLIQFPLKHLFP